MKKHLLLALTLVLMVSTASSQTRGNDDECDPDLYDCSRPNTISEPNQTIYPYVPFSTSEMNQRLKRLHEGSPYVSNLFEMSQRGLDSSQTKTQPWGGPFWPLNHGMIANTYQDKDYRTWIFSIREMFSWTRNVNNYKKRRMNVHPRIYDLSEKELAKLAPSEKYDLLLGDTSFDLTNRIWNKIETHGNEKRWGFLSAIDLPDGYRLPDANKKIAMWEGICHGWAVAAGHSPRPEKTVVVTLPNGKKMPFYPNDIKALVSLMWAHSTIQDNVIFEGNRCNRKYPEKDKYGRYIDLVKDPADSELLPRCADVHPAIFHVAMVNILGVEGRSFIVDINSEGPVANQPISSYEITYYNPENGKDGPLSRSVVQRSSYSAKDPFNVSRHQDSTQIVGVSVRLRYIDWESPRKKETNSPKDDDVKSIRFNYDLELDSQGKILGGQWRVSKSGKESNGDTKQPDFFWVVPRDWKNYFAPTPGLPKWDFARSSLPPREYAPAAKVAHQFIYEESKRFFLTPPMCTVFPIKGEGHGPIKQVECEFKFPRPQPLIQVVNKLLEESRK